jgi:hypothetical protein
MDHIWSIEFFKSTRFSSPFSRVPGTEFPEYGMMYIRDPDGTSVTTLVCQDVGQIE